MNILIISVYDKSYIVTYDFPLLIGNHLPQKFLSSDGACRIYQIMAISDVYIWDNYTTMGFVCQS